MPDLLASNHPGDLFTMRNVGNLVPPATADGVSVGGVSEASAIEYAVLVLKVAHASPAAFRLEQEGALDPALKRHDQLSQLNVLVEMEHLLSYPIVRELVTAGTLHLSGWWFDIAADDTYSYERASRSFEVIDRQVAQRIIVRLGEA